MKNKALEDIARNHAEEAVATLVDLLRTGSDGAKRAAAEALLDRAFGKPIDRQAVLQLGGNSQGDAEALTKAQLLRIASGALSEGGGGSQVIDLHPVSGDEDG